MATFTFEQTLTLLSPQAQQPIMKEIIVRDQAIADLQYDITEAQQMFHNPSNTWMVVNISSDLWRSSDAIWGTFNSEGLAIWT